MEVRGRGTHVWELLQACGQIWRPAQQVIRAQGKSVVFCCRGKTHGKYPGHGCLAAAVRMRMYLWWEKQLKMSADQVYVTRRMLKGWGYISSSPLRRRGAGIL
jgi:hypothetical protein